jgi:hypothetical protein
MGPVGWLSEANDAVKGAVFRFRLDDSSDNRGDARLHEVSARVAAEKSRCSK